MLENVSIAAYLKFEDKKDYIAFDESRAVIAPLPEDSIRKFNKNSKSQSTLGLEKGNIRALHVAMLSKGSSKIINLLLQEELNYHQKFMDDDVLGHRRDIVTLRDSAGRTPLIIACLQGAEIDIIRKLLDIDELNQSITVKDSFGNTPLHYACSHKYANVEVVKLLLEVEDEFYSLSCNDDEEEESDDGVINLYHFDLTSQASKIPTRNTKVKNKQNMNPLRLAVKSGAPTEVLEILLEADKIDLSTFEENNIFDLSKRVTDSKPLQDCINHRLAERVPCAMLISSLILKSIMFTLVLVATDKYITDCTFNAWVVPTFAVYLFFEIFKELCELINNKARYFVKKLKIVDLTRVVVMIMTVNVVSRHLKQQDQVIENGQKPGWIYFLMLSGIFLGIDIILSLRSTFLPFAKFSGGLFVITKALVPFLVVSMIFIICFTFAYRVSTMNDKGKEIEGLGLGEVQVACVDSFQSCLYAVLNSFFKAGSEDLTQVLDMLFGFIVILILLTIVIAIVSDAWNSVESKAALYYWDSRISFLADINTSLWNFNSKNRFSSITEAVTNLAKKIDDFGYGNMFNRDRSKFSWSKDAPYNLVSDIDQYYEPHEYFHKDDADKILAAHSLRSEYHWICHCRFGIEQKFSLIGATIRWFFYFGGYALLVILGVVTGGFFWPVEFRRYILSYGYKSDEYVFSASEEIVDKILMNVNPNVKEDEVQKKDFLSKLELIEQMTFETKRLKKPAVNSKPKTYTSSPLKDKIKRHMSRQKSYKGSIDMSTPKSFKGSIDSTTSP